MNTILNIFAVIMTILLFLVFALVIILGIIEIQQGQRRIPVQYAKRVVGRKMYGGQSTHIPLKVAVPADYYLLHGSEFRFFAVGSQMAVTDWFTGCVGIRGILRTADNILHLLLYGCNIQPEGSCG